MCSRLDPCAGWVPKDTLRSADGEGLSRAFTVQELLGALRALKPHKAAGPDDVPVEVLQLADAGVEWSGV
jgi:hypothetical protein